MTTRCIYSGCNKRAAPARKMCAGHLGAAADRVRRGRLEKNRRGLCLVEGCKRRISRRSKSMCATHMADTRDRVRNIYAARRKAGRCRSCPAPLSPKSTVWCERHREAARKQRKARAAARIARGLCGVDGCSRRISKRSARRCWTHLEAERKAARLRSRKYRAG